jgi:hypothetical protein
MDYQNASTVVDKILALPKDRKNLVAITLWTWWSAHNNINAGEKLKTTEEICHSIVEVKSVFFVTRMKQLNTCSSNVVSLGLYSQLSM